MIRIVVTIIMIMIIMIMMVMIMMIFVMLVLMIIIWNDYHDDDHQVPDGPDEGLGGVYEQRGLRLVPR